MLQHSHISRLPFLLILLWLLIVSETSAQRRGKQPATPAERAVATVNGTSIPYRLYDQLRQDRINMERQGGSIGTGSQYTDDALFAQLVDEELVRQEAARHHISVSHDAAMKLLLADPPDYLKDVFTDEKGDFKREIFQQVVRKPELIARLIAPGAPADSVIASWKEDIEKVIRYIQTSEMRRKLTDALYAQKPLTADAIRHRYFAEKTTVDGSFVRVLHSTIPDSLVPISESESRAWYASHQEDYRVAPSRSVASVILPIEPLPADSAAVRSRIDSVRRIIEGTPAPDRAAAVTRALRGLPPNRIPSGTIVTLPQLPPAIAPAIRGAKPGDLIGPAYQQGEAVYFYVDAVVPSRDTILRARHILLRATPEERKTDSANYELAVALQRSITNDSIFIEAAKIYSQDGSAKRGGDLGYFRRNQMVPAFDSAAFAAKVGEVIGPVRTSYGYHLIRVTERLTEGYYLRELRFPIVPSAAARSLVETDARRYAEALRTGVPTDSMLASLRGKYPGMIVDSSLIKRMQPYGDAFAANRFAFDAKAGDVGIIRLPYDRLMVLKVTKIWPYGILPYEEIKAYPIAHARRTRQLEMLKPRMTALRDSMTPGMLLGAVREIAPMAEIFLVNNQPVSSPPDEEPTILDSLIEVTPENGVSGPVRGKHGWYFLRVIDRQGPSQAQFQQEREKFTGEYTERYRGKLLEELMTRARDYADVKDLRPEEYVVN
jgi:parvulin-like peptidyl-prolyl isomerase